MRAIELIRKYLLPAIATAIFLHYMPSVAVVANTVSTTAGTSWMFREAETDLFTDEEKRILDDNVLSWAEQIWDCYADIELEEGPDYASNIVAFSTEQRKRAAEALGSAGAVSVTDGMNMVNGQQVTDFFANCQNREPAQVTVCEVRKDGLIAAVTFRYLDDRVQTYYVGVKPDSDKQPMLIGRMVQDVDFIRLTEKGYFFYSYANVLTHASLCNYFRVSPLPDKCRELTERYLTHLSFQKYNLMVKDWEAGNAADLLMPGLFEDFYYIRFGEVYRESNSHIEGELFETIMTTYLPVTVEQLREAFPYNEEEQTYSQDTVYNSPYPPFLEVTDYTENADGTIILCADGVWPDYKSDYAFSDVIVVQPLEDGTFRFLSNDVTEQELSLPPVAYRSRTSRRSCRGVAEHKVLFHPLGRSAGGFISVGD